MFVKKRKRQSNTFCEFCTCEVCNIRSWHCARNHDRLICKGGARICVKCYYGPCDTNKVRYCRTYAKTGDCIHRPILAKPDLKQSTTKNEKQ